MDTLFIVVFGGLIMQTKDIFNVFFREKPAMMLVALKNAKNEI